MREIGLIGGLMGRSFIMAAAIAAISAALPQRASALSLASPANLPLTKQAVAGSTIQVQHHGHGGGGFHGGGFRGGGFHGGGFRGGHIGGLHGGGFHGGGFHGLAGRGFNGGGFQRHGFHGGGFHRAPAFYGGYRHFHRPHFYRHHFHRRVYHSPAYYYPGYYHTRRFCRVVLTHSGPRRICHRGPWWRHHHRHHWRYRY
jgi:hypothetical protein